MRFNQRFRSIIQPTLFVHYTNAASGFIAYIICAKAGNTGTYGEFVVTSASFWILGNLTIFGMNNVLLISINESRSKVNSIKQDAIMICLFTTSLCVFTYHFVAKYIPEIIRENILTIFAILILFCVNRIFLAEFQKKETFSTYVFANIVRNASLIFGLFLNVFTELLSSMTYSILLSELGFALYIFSKQKQFWAFVARKRKIFHNLPETLTEGRKVLLTNFLIESLGKPETILVGIFFGLEYAGFFSLMLSFVETSSGILWSRSLTVNAEFSKLGKNKSGKARQIKQEARELKFFALLLGILGMPAFLVLGNSENLNQNAMYTVLAYLSLLLSRTASFEISIFSKIFLNFQKHLFQNMFYIALHFLNVVAICVGGFMKNLTISCFLIMIFWLIMAAFYGKRVEKLEND